MSENNKTDEALQSPFRDPPESLASEAVVAGSPVAELAVNGLALPSALPRYIPEGHPARTLVLCFDGTGDQ